MFYELTNGGVGSRVVYNARGRGVEIPGRKTVRVDLNDEAAVTIKRLSSSGDKLSISEVDDDGRAVLERASEPRPRKKPFQMVHGAGDALALALRGGGAPFRDELEDESQPQESGELGLETQAPENQEPEQVEVQSTIVNTHAPSRGRRRGR